MKWVSVEDQLPPIATRFLAGYVDDGDCMILYFDDEEDRDYYMSCVDSFKYWMHLPKVPKKKIEL